ncbi:hypothetical protein [Alistipes sp.]|jgi:hypothetical protein|uniref:hypothetical protein n=1 Tax=Alistipes sp. TaxID=1872444 RepID=UPI0023F14BA7|nr:hypothetical protein [Alistipes sp.]
MEKLTKSLCILTALALLAACDKDADSGVQIPAAKTNFEVSLPGALETYGVEDPQAAGQITPYYDNVTVYLVDAGGNATYYAWTNDEIKAKQKRFEQITEPAQVLVIVNSGSAILPTGTVPLSELTAAMMKSSVVDHNQIARTLAVEDAKGNAAGTYNSVQQVMLAGEQSVFTTETSDDGHTLKKASVELSSIVSRFEIGTVKKGTGLDALTVEAVYVNNFLNFNGGALNSTIQNYNEITWPATFTPAWATDSYNAAVTSATGTKAYAYQVFSGNVVPHIIYKVSGTVSAGYKLADGTGDADNSTSFTGKYITVKGFRDSGSLISEIEPHKIYKLGLEDGGIEITPDKITDKPEKAKIDLIVAVSVADWTVANVTPEI